MEPKNIFVDFEYCVGCRACEVACKQENDLPVGPRWSHVVTVEPRWVKGELCTDFVFTTCFQCAEPVCAYVCPTSAITKRDDGIVVIDEAKCNGCGLCVSACPFGAMYIDPEKNVAWKCSFCIDRIDHGLEPSCVQHCVGSALQYVTPEELLKLTAGKHKARIGMTCYVSEKWKLSNYPLLSQVEH